MRGFRTWALLRSFDQNMEPRHGFGPRDSVQHYVGTVYKQNIEAIYEQYPGDRRERSTMHPPGLGQSKNAKYGNRGEVRGRKECLRGQIHSPDKPGKEATGGTEDQMANVAGEVQPFEVALVPQSLSSSAPNNFRTGPLCPVWPCRLDRRRRAIRSPGDHR